ncbi:sensor histidine kinase [Paenibacillus sp. MWE-103]|uniref:Sensor histidine kinase n=1 Tax=Paenibacillus artemisiicola TaxID=1172618 RepID=A0ABS3W984_9BACL|nr:sensor histidine kinase [Paenibacillus artemisiicola]MBO7744858.1 sensor histidine kinase [Paenibacillus artemisiicola]
MLTLRKASGWLSFNRVSLKYRLLLYFLLLVILPTSIISVTIYNQSYRTITDNMTASVQKNLNMMETVLLKKFDDMDGVADAIYLNPDMIDMLSADRPADQVGFVNELASFNKILDGYAQPEGPGKRFVPKLYMLDRPEYVQYNFSRNVSTISEIEKEPWYAALPPKARYTVAGLQAKSGPGGAAYTIKLAKRLFGLKNMTIPYVGLLTIDADVADFNALLAQLKPSANSAVFILDERANVIVSPDPGLLGRSLADQPYVPELLKRGGGAGSFDEEIGGQAELVSYRKLADPGWTIVSVSPISDLNGKLVAFRQAMYVVLAACMALAFFIALLLSNNIAKPIRKFVKTMSYAQEGNFDIQIQYKRKDEFTYLFSQYNKMIMQIKELINKLYVSEVKKKEAELKALQAQINPHFLYNTLDSINWIALRHDVPDISEMVTSLSDFFRYSLSKGRSVIPLEDELRQVGSYLAIHKFRFKDKLDYAIRVDPEVHGHYTVKLVLQPLVENAILHGIEKRHGKGRIDVVARKRGDRIEIEIADDGVGADPDVLNARLESGTGEDGAFGTINVNRRLKQTFGEQAGIRYRRREGPGIVVVATMPAVTTWEENEDAQDDHRR